MSLKEHLLRQAYYLTYERKPVPTIVVHIREDLLEATKRVGVKEGLIIKAKHRRGDLPFENSFEKNWGFEGTSINRGFKDGFLRIAFAIPPYWIYSNDPCPNCGGTGQDDVIEGRKCFECYGTKKARLDPPVSIGRTIESLSLLLWYLYCVFLDEKKFAESQDLLIDVVTHIKGSAPIGGEMSTWFSEACMTLKKKYDAIPGYRQTDFPKALKAMKATYSHIMPTRSDPSCRVEIGNVGFFLDVPSNACNLAADHYAMGNILDEGFSCHNVDGACQQTSLLVGLIVFYHEVLEEIYKT